MNTARFKITERLCEFIAVSNSGLEVVFLIQPIYR